MGNTRARILDERNGGSDWAGFSHSVCLPRVKHIYTSLYYAWLGLSGRCMELQPSGFAQPQPLDLPIQNLFGLLQAVHHQHIDPTCAWSQWVLGIAYVIHWLPAPANDLSLSLSIANNRLLGFRTLFQGSMAHVGISKCGWRRSTSDGAFWTAKGRPVEQASVDCTWWPW